MEECAVSAWQPDNDVSACPHCGKSFGFFHKRHHCRFCGHVVCVDCSKEKVVESATNKGTYPRACVTCEQRSKKPPPAPAPSPKAVAAAPSKAPAKAQAPPAAAVPKAVTPASSTKAVSPTPASSPKPAAAPKAAHVDPTSTPTSSKTPNSPTPPESINEGSPRETAEAKEEAALGVALCHRLQQQGRVMNVIKKADKAASGLHEKLETIQSVLEVGAQFFSHIPLIGEPLEKVTGLIAKVFKIAKTPMANAKLVIDLFDRIAALSVPLRLDFETMKASKDSPKPSALLEAIGDILDEAFELVQQFAGDPEKPLTFLSAFNPKNWKQKSEDSFSEIHRKIDSALLSRSYEISVKAPTMDEIRSALAKERSRLEGTVNAVQRGVERLRQGQEVIGDQLNKLNERITELQQESQFRSVGLKWKVLASPEKLVVMEDNVVAEGSQFIVVEGRYLDAPVAVKIVKREVLLSNCLEELFTEASFLSTYQHDNMIAFHGVHRARGQVMLVEELGGVSLAEALSTLEVLPMEKSSALRVVHGVVKAVAFLHRRGVMHKDICPRNILLCTSSEGDVSAKLCSFGQARQSTSGGQLVSTKTNIRYQAPEGMHETLNHHSSLASDCYSIGVLAWQLLSGAVPWAGLSDEVIIAKVQHGERLNCNGFESDVIGSDIATLLDDASYRPDIESTHEMVLEWQQSYDGTPSSPLAPLALPSKFEFGHYNRQQLCQFLSRSYPPPDPEEDDPLLPISRTSRVWECIERDQWDGEMLLEVTKAEFSSFFPKISETNRLWDRIEAVRQRTTTQPTSRHVISKSRPRVPWNKEWLRMTTEERLHWLRAYGVISSTISFVSKRTGKELLNVDAIENDLEEPTVNVPAPHKKKLLRLLNSIANKEMTAKAFETKVACIASSKAFLTEFTKKLELSETVSFDGVGTVLPEIAAFALFEEELASTFLATVMKAVQVPSAAAATIRGQLGLSLQGIARKYFTAAALPNELFVMFLDTLDTITASPYFQEFALQTSTCGLDRELLLIGPRVPADCLLRYLPLVVLSVGAGTVTVLLDGSEKQMSKWGICVYLLDNAAPTYRVYSAVISLSQDTPIVLSDGRSVTPMDAAQEYARLTNESPHRMSVSWYIWSRLFTLEMGAEGAISINGVDMTATQVCVEAMRIALVDPRTHVTTICGIASRMSALKIASLTIDGSTYSAVDFLVKCIEHSKGAPLDTPWEQLGSFDAVKKNGVTVNGRYYSALQCTAQVIALRRYPTSLQYCLVALALPDKITVVEINGIGYTKLQLYERALEVAVSPQDFYRAWNYLGKIIAASEVVTLLGKPVSKVQAFVNALEARPDDRPAWLSLYNVLEKGATITVNGRSYNDRAALVEHLRLPATASTDATSWKNLGACIGPNESVTIGEEIITKHVAYAKSLNLDDTNHVTWQNVYLSLTADKPTFSFRGQSLSKLQCLSHLINVSKTDEQRATNFNRAGFVLNAGESVELQGRSFTELDCFIEAVQYNPKLSAGWANICAQLRQKPNSKATISGKEVTAKDAGLQAVQVDSNNAFAWWNLAALIGNSTDRLELLDGTTTTQLQCYIKYCSIPGEAPFNLCIAFTALGMSLDNTNTVSVGNSKLTKKDCFVRALTYRRDVSSSWTNVASVLSPTSTATIVGGATYTIDQCLTEALKIDGADAGKRSQVFVKAAAMSVTHHRCTFVINGTTMTTRDMYAAALEANHHLIETWYNAGIELLKAPLGGTITVQGEAASAVKAFSMYLERVVPADGNKYVRINAWYNLGRALAGAGDRAAATVGDSSVTYVQALARAVELEASRVGSWFMVADVVRGNDTVVVSGEPYNKVALYSKTFQLATSAADKASVWLKIATDVLSQPNAPPSVNFCGQSCTKETAIAQALKLVPRHADSWWAAAEWTKSNSKPIALAINQQTVSHTTSDCYVQFVSCPVVPDMTASMRSAAFLFIGRTMPTTPATVVVSNAKMGKFDCLLRAVSIDASNKEAWSVLASSMSPTQFVTLDGVRLDSGACAARAK